MSRLTGFSPIVRRLIKERAGTHDYLVRCERCGVWREDIALHHRRPRGMGSTRRPETNEAPNGLCACTVCHHDTEMNREAARATGWLLAQHQTPAEIPVELHDGWYLLAEDGQRYAVPSPHRNKESA